MRTKKKGLFALPKISTVGMKPLSERDENKKKGLFALREKSISRNEATL